MKKQSFGMLTLLLALFVAPAWGAKYSEISAEELRTQMMREAMVTLVDIQTEENYRWQHLPGAISTAATPVQSAADQAKLAKLAKQLKSGSEPVIIISLQGDDDARRAYDYLLTQGISAKRLQILRDGQQGWPYADMLATD